MFMGGSGGSASGVYTVLAGAAGGGGYTSGFASPYGGVNLQWATQNLVQFIASGGVSTLAGRNGFSVLSGSANGGGGGGQGGLSILDGNAGDGGLGGLYGGGGGGGGGAYYTSPGTSGAVRAGFGGSGAPGMVLVVTYK
jgi:hypothetical protein